MRARFEMQNPARNSSKNRHAEDVHPGRAISANDDPAGALTELKHQRRRWPGRETAALAARQRALITSQQLAALGVGRGPIHRAREDGRLYAMHRGVYAIVPRQALPPPAAEHAAVLALAPNAYVSHHSAAALWGIRPCPSGGVDVTVVGRKPGSRNGIRVHRVHALERRDTRVLERIPITSPASALLEIALDLSDRELERPFGEAIAKRVMTLRAAHAMLMVNPRRAGAARLRALVLPDRSLMMTRSEREERFLELVRKAGLPSPEVNARVGPFEVDFCWRQERVVVEIDGFSFHSSRAALERDHHRDAQLQQMGFVVIRILGRELHRAPERVLVRVASALALRRAA